MAYPDEIQKIVNSIPKEHHAKIQRIIQFYYAHGVAEVQEVLRHIGSVKPGEFRDYGFYHDSSLDGG